MKKRLIYILLFALVALVFAACGPTAQQKEEARVRRSKTPNPVTWDTIVLNKTEPLDVKGVKASASLSVHFITPKTYENVEILAKIKSEIAYEVVGEDHPYANLETREALNKYMSEYLVDYKKEAKAQVAMWNKVNGTDMFSYQKEIKSEVLYNEANLISYQISSTENGGDDTLATILVSNILVDLTNGNVLTEGDVFIEGYKEKLDQLLIKQILKDNEVKEVEDAQAKGYWGITDITSNNNFYVTRDGITYTFNPDEYADATLGVLNIFLDFDKVDDLIKKDSPISILLED